MALTEAGAMALSAVGSLGSSVSGGLFGINQARKNRAFQERMFDKQVQVNRENWDLENRYNLPSAQVQRLLDANLNPYLMYSGGASGLTSQGSIGNPSQPHGAMASANFGNPVLDALQAKMINAQVNNIEANTEKTRSETDWQELENKFNRDTLDVRIAIKYGDLEMLNTSVEKLQTDMMNSTRLTTQQVLTMIQAREYEVKRYNLSEYEVGERVKQGWSNVAIGRVQASAAMKQAIAAVQNAASTAKLTDAQVGQIALNMSQSKEMFPLLKKGQTIDNVLKSWQSAATKAGVSKTQQETYSIQIKNYYEKNFNKGAYDSQLGKTVNDISTMFYMPWIANW